VLEFLVLSGVLVDAALRCSVGVSDFVPFMQFASAAWTDTLIDPSLLSLLSLEAIAVSTLKAFVLVCCRARLHWARRLAKAARSSQPVTISALLRLEGDDRLVVRFKDHLGARSSSWRGMLEWLAAVGHMGIAFFQHSPSAGISSGICEDTACRNGCR